MRNQDYLRGAADSLRTHRLRSFLTMLGVIVGVLTVVLTLGIGAGAQDAIHDRIEALGSNLIVVNSGPPPGPSQRPFTSTRLTRRQSVTVVLWCARSLRSRKRDCR